MKYVYPLEPNADITEGLDDRVVDMLLNHRDKINKIVEVINSNFHLEEPESRLTTTEAQQIEMANDFRDILRPYHKEGEYYTATLKRVLFSPEKKEEVCVAGDTVLLSNPPQNKCINCGSTWICGNKSPVCKSKVEKEEPTQEFTKRELTVLHWVLGAVIHESKGDCDSDYEPLLSKIEKMLK